LIGNKQQGAPTIVAMAGEREAGEKQTSPAIAELCARNGRESLAETGVEVVDPTRRPDWDSLVSGYAGSAFYHGSGWARVLAETYGHRPVYLCRMTSGQIQAVLPVMEVSSLWTGRRGVSLPFTDYCRPLPDSSSCSGLYEEAVKQGRKRGWRYLESRGSRPEWPGCSPAVGFWGHVIEFDRSLEVLFKNLDGAVRRAIRKARGTNLRVEFSGSVESVRAFYALHCQTRRRHGVPPQPVRFFENTARFVLGPGGGFLATAWLGRQPVAAAVFFHFGREAVFKFGASDYGSQHLRPNDLLMWECIGRCAQQGCERLHLGRTSLGNEGLRRFKLGFGAREERIEYYRHDLRRGEFVAGADRAENWINGVFRRLPLPVLRVAGRMLYPHLS
jgi:hypothetical protein